MGDLYNEIEVYGGITKLEYASIKFVAAGMSKDIAIKTAKELLKELENET